jgi:flavodoxin
MRAVVVYETEYGNSENVVRAIAEVFGEHGEAAWCPAQDH